MQPNKDTSHILHTAKSPPEKLLFHFFVAFYLLTDPFINEMHKNKNNSVQFFPIVNTYTNKCLKYFIFTIIFQLRTMSYFKKPFFIVLVKCIEHLTCNRMNANQAKTINLVVSLGMKLYRHCLVPFGPKNGLEDDLSYKKLPSQSNESEFVQTRLNLNSSNTK